MLTIPKIRLPKISIDWVLGFLTAIPFAYPKEPFYWIVIILFFLGLYRFKAPEGGFKYILIVLLLICYVNLVNIFNGVYNLSVFGTCLSISLLLFRYIVKNTDEYFKGLSFVTTIYAFATFVFFIILKPYTNGLFMFINSDYRMWADGYLIEWPNVFCAFLVIGGFIQVLYDNKKLAYTHFSAAILTTSRTALLAVIIYALFTLSKKRSISKYIYSMVIIAVLLLVYFTFNSDDTFNSLIFDRLIKTSDRGEIYSALIDSFLENVFGIGNVPFEQIDAQFESYHSSYLKVLSRYGVIGLLLWLFLTYPKNLFKKHNLSVNMPIIFIMLCGIVQDFMFHMHILALYSVLLMHREKLLREEV